jgi:hypothetical protein
MHQLFTVSFLLLGCAGAADLSALAHFNAWFRDGGGEWGPGISPSVSESPCALVPGAASFRVNADARVSANSVRSILFVHALPPPRCPRLSYDALHPPIPTPTTRPHPTPHRCSSASRFLSC